MQVLARSAALALALFATNTMAQELAPGVAGSYLAARQASVENDYKAAARLYTQALARDPMNHAHMENALSAYLALAEYEAAAVLADRMLQTGSRSQIANMSAVAGEAMAGDYAALSASFEAGTRVGPLVDALLIGWAKIGAGDFAGGLTAFDDIAERDGLRPFALHHKALAQAYAGNMEGA
ncbi:MAG: hypothetical protein AAFR53_16755, partial [Pseudomonadota bacterium]